MKTILWLVAVVLVFDCVGYILWSISGQTPVNNTYIGAITAKIISILK